MLDINILQEVVDGCGWVWINADCTANPQSGNAPLVVSFIDESTSSDTIDSWQWDFQNDGVIDSYEQNPS